MTSEWRLGKPRRCLRWSLPLAKCFWNIPSSACSGMQRHTWHLGGFPCGHAGHWPQPLSASLAGFNSLVGGVMGFSILLSAEVFKHNSAVWYLDGSIGVLIGLTIFAYGVK